MRAGYHSRVGRARRRAGPAAPSHRPLGAEVLEPRLLLAQTTGLFFNDPGAQDGYVLFSPNTSTNTYLIDKNGAVVNQWHSSYQPGLLGYLLPDGSLLRDASPHGQGGNGSIVAAGAGGLLERFDWNGTKIWQYSYDSPTHLAHHDFEVLPNGNVLLIAWELKSDAEATQAGRDPNLPGPGYLYPDSIVEVQPDLASGNGGTIVWQWHIWDHLVQDYDQTKSNWYGATGVADHPELINLNFVSTADDGAGAPEDWTHCNGIDYNPLLDQIVLSSREFSEFWIIDHSTTTAQAASHSGGRSGHGGDVLYRYGNPAAYDRGTAADRVFYYQHDPKWIPAGVPGAGDITVFNNGVGRPGTDYSSVWEITPPTVDASGNYALAVGAAYGPATPTWTYTAPAENFSAIISSATRLAGGNTLIDFGVKGTFIEVTPDGQQVWKYVNPYTGAGTLGLTTPIPSLGVNQPLLDSLYTNFTFQAIFYAKNYLSPRHVSSVAVDSTSWTGGFLNTLASTGHGDGSGYRIPVGSAAQLSDLPWSNLNQVRITFDGPVHVQQGSLTVSGYNVASYGFSGFSYDANKNTATWTLASPIAQDKVLLTLATTGSSAVTDPTGAPLDGEWANKSTSSSSGNGTPGGDFRFRFNVLPGDANQDGRVDTADVSSVQADWLHTGAIATDLNGDGSVNVLDVTICAEGSGHRFSSLRGDANNDGVVNGLDIALIAAHWLSYGLLGDVNDDTVVNGLDIAAAASSWLEAEVQGTGFPSVIGAQVAVPSDPRAATASVAAVPAAFAAQPNDNWQRKSIRASDAVSGMSKIDDQLLVEIASTVASASPRSSR